MSSVAVDPSAADVSGRLSGSPVHDPDLGTAFQARHLAVPIAQAVSVGPEESSATAATALSAGRFDQAPVMAGGKPVGFVLTRYLTDHAQRPVAEAMTPLGSGNVVSADASVGQLLEWIVDPGFLFVLEGRDITGFITPTDFNKQPARAYLYLLLATLETGIAELIRLRFGPRQSTALELLPEAGQTTVRERYEADQALGEEGELVAYFDFSDLICVVRQDRDIREWLGYSRSRWSRDTGGLVKLRNEVMHPVRNMVLAKGGLIQLQGREQRIRAVVASLDQALGRMTTHDEAGSSPG